MALSSTCRDHNADIVGRLRSLDCYDSCEPSQNSVSPPCMGASLPYPSQPPLFQPEASQEHGHDVKAAQVPIGGVKRREVEAGIVAAQAVVEPGLRADALIVVDEVTAAVQDQL